jgi:hypothetical protein
MLSRIRSVIAVLTASALLFAPSASADIGLLLTTKDVHVGGLLRGWSNGSGFPIYIVPSSLARVEAAPLTTDAAAGGWTGDGPDER